MSLFGELKRRNVFRVGIAYAVVSWLVLQVADIVFEAIGTPDWVMQTLLVVLAIGLLFALFFAWAFELTPEGLKREREVDRSQSITTQTGRKLDYTIIALLALALGYFIWESRFAERLVPVRGETIAATGIEAAETEPEPEISRQSIAVLPFDNRSRLEEDEFFVEGVHDDLLTSLARIGSLKVISRTSVGKYADTEKTIPEIASELGVANVMEGAVQRSGNTVRINVQLIDAQTDEHLWADIFDRELTAENLFTIQSEISQAIARALQATLSPEEEQRINIMPTDNLAAYEAFIRGRQLLLTRQSAKLQQAHEEFTAAVELDPNFALAWVGLAESQLLLSSYGALSRAEAMAAMEQAIDQALAINTDVGEAYASLGQIHNYHQRYEEAEAAYQKAIELSPGYATAWHWYGNLVANFPARAQERLQLVRRARELDPNSPVLRNVLAQAYRQVGQYTLAEHEIRKVIELEPGFAAGHSSLANLFIFALSRFDEGVLSARKAIELDPGNLGNLALLAMGYQALDDEAAMSATLEQMEGLNADHQWTAWMSVLYSDAHGTAAGTREAARWALPKVHNLPFAGYYLATLELIHGDQQRAWEIFLSIEPGWNDPEQWIGLVERYPYYSCIAAWLNIATGADEQGRELLSLATHFFTETLPATREHVDAFGPDVCYLAAGDAGRALDSIETQLAHRHITLWDVYHRMPMYDLIRDEPRYQAALTERERIIAEQRERLAQMNLDI